MKGCNDTSPPLVANEISCCRLFISLLQQLSTCSICVGNNDDEFVEFCLYRKGVLHDKSGTICITISISFLINRYIPHYR